MLDNKVKGLISELFDEMDVEVSKIIKKAPTTEMAIEEVMNYVSSTITASTQGYMVDLYSALTEQTMNDEIFKDPANANKFYELNLRQQISDSYQFDIQDLNSYEKGINFAEINDSYATAAATVGSAAVGGILLGALSGVVHIPMVVIIAGAVLAGIAGGSVAHCKVVPEKNKEKFSASVGAFMIDLKLELLDWVDEVEKFYNEKVEELKKTL